MGVILCKKKDGITRKISESYQVTNILTKDLSKGFSLAVSEATKHSETTMNVRSDRAYYVLEGRLTVSKDGKRLSAGPGDVIFIPKNTEYSFSGTFKAVLINSPAFNPKDERISKL